jgi:hypothetical protein
MTTKANKFTMCVLPTQLGKTFNAVERINAELAMDYRDGSSIHIIHTMNTLLNNNQFATRLSSIQRGNNSICVFSSTYKGEYRHAKSIIEVKGFTCDLTTRPKIVVMCSNNTRFSDTVEFIKYLDNVTDDNGIKRVFVYYDELHNYIENNNLRSQIEEINNFDICKGIVALTATPEKIWNESPYWSNIQLINLRNLQHENYIGYDDMIYNNIDDYFPTPFIRPKYFDFEQHDNNTCGYVEHVIKMHPEILTEGSRVFIPAHVRCSGHDRIRNMIFTECDRAVVIVINGRDKSLQFIENGQKKTIPLTSQREEVSTIIAKTIDELELQGRPLIMTGLLCVGMGQTLTNKSYGSFTSAIISHLDMTNDQIYQLFGRITGRMREWSTYVKTQVYIPTISMQRCRAMEDCAFNMVGMNGSKVSIGDYKQPIIDLGDDGLATIDNIRPVKIKKEKKNKRIIENKEFRVFDSRDEARDFAKENLDVTFNKSRSNTAPKTMLVDKENPSVDYILKRWWGLENENSVRMIPTNDGKWCVYWVGKKPSNETV